MSDNEYEEEQATPAQKLQIANYFVMSAPAGEVDEVVKDTKKLINDNSVLTANKVEEILTNYNIERMIYAVNPDDKDSSIIVCTQGKIKSDQFLDPNTGDVYAFDHVNRKFTEKVGNEKQCSGATESIRAATAKAVAKYVTANYSAKKCVSAVYGKDKTLTICVSGQNIHLGNFWTGSWRGVYTVTVGGKGSAKITGSSKVQVHYFEDGNVQLHANIDHDATITLGDEAKTAQAIADAITTFEGDFQNNLEEMYINMHRDTFKKMRRFLPMSRRKMEWSVAAHSVAAALES